jgi:hypothetical protein
MNAKHEVKWSNPGAAGADSSCELRESGSFVCTSDSAGVVDVTNSSYSKIGLDGFMGKASLTFGFQSDGSLAVSILHPRIMISYQIMSTMPNKDPLKIWDSVQGTKKELFAAQSVDLACTNKLTELPIGGALQLPTKTGTCLVGNGYTLMIDEQFQLVLLEDKTMTAKWTAPFPHPSDASVKCTLGKDLNFICSDLGNPVLFSSGTGALENKYDPSLLSNTNLMIDDKGYLSVRSSLIDRSNAQMMALIDGNPYRIWTQEGVDATAMGLIKGHTQGSAKDSKLSPEGGPNPGTKTNVNCKPGMYITAVVAIKDDNNNMVSIEATCSDGATLPTVCGSSTTGTSRAFTCNLITATSVDVYSYKNLGVVALYFSGACGEYPKLKDAKSDLVKTNIIGVQSYITGISATCGSEAQGFMFQSLALNYVAKP